MRSVLAVLAGMVLWGGLWNAASAAFASSFDEDGAASSDGVLVFFLAFSVALSLGAGALTAKVARDAASRCVLVLAIIHLVIGVLVSIATRDVVPAWYHVPFNLLIVPAHVVGGKWVSR